MTLRIGVLPAASRNTPTPTSILSGRWSALANAIRASRESCWTGGRSASPLALALVCVSMACDLAGSGVVIHCHAVPDRDRLASQDIAGGDFFIGQAVPRGHLDLAAGDLGPASGANPGFAGEWSRQAGLPRTIEDVGLGEGDLAGPPIERDADAQPGRLLLELGHLRGQRRRRPPRREPLDMDPFLVDIAVEQRG